MSNSEHGNARPSRAGWYPDPRNANKRRYWDGERWSELSATGEAGPTGTPDAPTPAPSHDGAGGRPDRRRALVAVAVVALVVVLGAAAWAVLGGSDDSTDDASATTSTSTTSTTNEPADPSTDDTAAPSGGPAPTATPDDGAPTTTVGGATDDGPGAPCEADAAALLGLLKAHPPLASFADDLGVERTRCVGDWSSAVVTSPDADRALALFRRDGDGWTLVLLGSAEPCSGLGIPTADEATLGCGEW